MITYPDHWRVERLQDVAKYKAGRTPSRANAAYWDGDGKRVPWVSISDMRLFGRVRSTAETITERAFADVFDSTLVPQGTLLMSFKLTIGRVATLGIPACHNEAIIALYPRPGVDQRFLGYFLAHVDYSSLHDRQIKGNTLNRAKIDAIPIALPDQSEQEVIANVLDHIRRAADVEQLCEETAAALKRSTMRAVFTRGLRGEAQKESEIGPIPLSWECVQFSRVREWLQYGTSVRCAAAVDKHPVLRIPNLIGGRIDSADLKYCDLSDKEAEGYALENGDLLFIRTNGVIERLGSCAVYEGTPSGALFASYLIRARIKPTLVPQFAAFFFSSELGCGLVADRATPAADGKYNLNTGLIDLLPIPLPPTTEEQHEIVKILDAIDRKLDIHKKKRAVLEDLFKSLLHKLMTGEIRVADLDLSALTTPAEQG